MADKSKIRIGHLNTVGGVVTEMARVYREMRRGELERQDGEALVRSLSAIRQGLEASDFESRLRAVEERDDKGTSSSPLRRHSARAWQ